MWSFLWSEALSLLRVLTSSDHCSISWKMSLWRALREFPSLVSLAIPFFRVAPSWCSPPWSSFAEPRLHGANYDLPLWRRLLPFCRSLSPTYVSCRSLSFSLVSLIASFLCIARRLFRVACLSHCHLNCSLWLFNTPKINGYKMCGALCVHVHAYAHMYMCACIGVCTVCVCKTT